MGHITPLPAGNWSEGSNVYFGGDQQLPPELSVHNHFYFSPWPKCVGGKTVSESAWEEILAQGCP